MKRGNRFLMEENILESLWNKHTAWEQGLFIKMIIKVIKSGDKPPYLASHQTTVKEVKDKLCPLSTEQVLLESLAFERKKQKQTYSGWSTCCRSRSNNIENIHMSLLQGVALLYTAVQHRAWLTLCCNKNRYKIRLWISFMMMNKETFMNTSYVSFNVLIVTLLIMGALNKNVVGSELL